MVRRLLAIVVEDNAYRFTKDVSRTSNEIIVKDVICEQNFYFILLFTQ
jgi:hypothetical protein